MWRRAVEGSARRVSKTVCKEQGVLNLDLLVDELHEMWYNFFQQIGNAK